MSLIRHFIKVTRFLCHTSIPKYSFPWPITASMYSRASRVAASTRSKVRYNLSSSAGFVSCVCVRVCVCVELVSECKLPECQLPKCKLPKMSTPTMSTPKMSTPKMSTFQFFFRITSVQSGSKIYFFMFFIFLDS